jgi:hypothetical protein
MGAIFAANLALAEIVVILRIQAFRVTAPAP